MIQFLLSILGVLLLVLIGFVVGVGCGVFLIGKGIETKIEEADEYERDILKKIFDK